jgi:hypothetical protein
VRLLVVSLLSLVFSLQLPAAVSSAAGEPTASWRAEWERNLQGAKKEGELILWGDMEITHPDIAQPFNKEYPFIKTITVTGKVGELMPHILAERRSGKFLADLYAGGLGGRAFFDFHRAGVLDPIKPALILPEVADESKWLNGKHHYADGDGQYVFMFEGNVAGVGKVKHIGSRVFSIQSRCRSSLTKP